MKCFHWFPFVMEFGGKVKRQCANWQLTCKSFTRKVTLMDLTGGVVVISRN